jgi:hypothetical protein
MTPAGMVTAIASNASWFILTIIEINRNQGKDRET